MSRYDRTVRGGLAPVLLLLGVCFAAPAFAAPADALMPVEKYTTDKARNLANAHRLRLIEFSEQIYNCMPWLAVYPGRIGFPRYKDSPGDDRYLSTWIWVDQREDPVFAALPQERRVSAMFSRYGVDMLRRMAALSDVVDDGDVAGLSVVLSWLKPGTSRPGQQSVNETLALFIDKATAADFLAKRVGPEEFISRAKFNLYDGESLVGRVPLQVWEDSFNSTYRVANYDPPKGAQCQ
ncbi:MAG TPA: hypothetical protein VMC04_18795 [Verrucomicrobiae bacterium]|jgi:hypothetical protein|nr:hypothetical protein [Verrucomicrobiae bacterium]